MRSIYRAFEFIDAVNDWLGRLVSPLIVLCVAILLNEVVLRYAFNRPTIWSAELVQIIFGFYFLLGGAYAFRHDAHVRVDILLVALPERQRRWLLMLSTLLALPFLLVLLWICADQAAESIAYRERADSTWEPYIYPVLTAAPIAILLMILQALSNVVRTWRGQKD